MRDTKKDMLTTSGHIDFDTTESIVLGEENDKQNDVDICKYDSNTLQQSLVEVHWIGNVILKE